MMSSNLENKLNSLNSSIDAFAQEISSMFRKLNSDVDALSRNLNSEVEPGEMDIPMEKPKAVKSLSKASAVDPITTPPRLHSVDEIDRQLGNIYGSNELRDAIHDALPRMASAQGVLARVAEQKISPFVRTEIEHLHSNIDVLQQIFRRMLARMEITESDEEDYDTDSKSAVKPMKKKPSVGAFTLQAKIQK